MCRICSAVERSEKHMIIEKIQENIYLAPMTTFKIGGPAKYFVQITSKDELVEAVDWAKEKGEKIFFFGGGSNVLVSDNIIDGLVIRLGNSRAEVKGERIECQSGTPLSQAIILSSGNGLSGLEWAIGIPGTIGGAIRGNAGAYGHSTSEVVETVEIFDFEAGKFSTFSKNDCAFGYRESVFKKIPKYIIVSATLKLNLSNPETVKATINEIISKRGLNHPKLPSAGSVFKNIKIEDLREMNPSIAKMVEKEGVVKGNMVGVGWLIEILGVKGKTMGGAKVSLEHGNFIVNTGKATASDVVMLISFIKQQMRTKFNIQLSEEIQYFGM